MIILLHYGLNQGHVLASNFPEFAEQWNYEKNGALTPWDVTTGSNKKVWWKCSLGHEWETAIADRIRYSIGCPYCAGRKAWAGFKDLATTAAAGSFSAARTRTVNLAPQQKKPSGASGLKRRRSLTAR